MTAIGTASNGLGPEWGMLDRERIIAQPGFNRWLVPPAALAIHLCIGMAYGFSVFWLPLSHAHRHHQVRRLPADIDARSAHCSPRAATGRSADLGWMYTLFFVFLGSVGGALGRLARARRARARPASSPRCCWGGGFLISALGVVPAPALAAVARLRRHRRHRPGPRLHLARSRR